MSEEAKPAELPVVLTDEDLKAVESVKDRLKFFFSDANVRQDYFIRKLLMDNKSNHSVSVESLLRFNTIKVHTTKPGVLIKAAKELSEVLKVDEKETSIGRVVTFTREMMNGHIPKSLHVKGLPLKNKEGEEGSKQYAVTVDQVRGLFEKYGDVAMIKLKFSSNTNGEDNGNKKGAKKHPTGCGLVEFSNEGDLEKAAEATLTTKNSEPQEPKDKLVIGDDKIELEVMLLSEIKKAKNNGESPNKKRKHEGDAGDDDEVKTFTVDWKPGCVIRIKGVPGDCDREALLDMLAEGMAIDVEQVKDRKIYVDYSRGGADGALRFPEFGDHIADICKRLCDGSLQVKSSKVEKAVILDGDEEKKYWDEFMAFKSKQIQQRADEKRAKKKHRHGGRR